MVRVPGPTSMTLRALVVAGALTAAMVPAAPGLADTGTPRAGSYALGTGSGRLSDMSTMLTVTPTRHGVNYWFFQIRLYCADGSRLPATYAFVSDRVTGGAPMRIRSDGFVEYWDWKDFAATSPYVGLVGRFKTTTTFHGALSVRNFKGSTTCLEWPAARTDLAFTLRWQGFPRVSIEPGAVRPGGSVLVRGSGFRKKELVTLLVPGTISPTTIRFRADRRGRFKRSARVGSPPDGVYRTIAMQRMVADITGGGSGAHGRLRGAANFVITRTGPVG